jgi:DHA2 family multidrug resistance protein-like MFS transporter
VEAKHKSPLTVGQALAVYALARSSVAWCSGRWSDRIDAHLLAVPGMILFMCGVAMLLRMDESSPVSAMTPALVLAGLGFGCFVPPNNRTLIGSAPRELSGFAAGIMATSRTVGMTIGVAFASAILSSASRSAASGAKLALGAVEILALAAAIASVFAASACNEPRGNRRVGEVALGAGVA